jgi:signal transduction histidine kinase
VALFVLAVVAPLGIIAGLSFQRVWRRQLANLDRQNISTARAISVAVDREIERTSASLSVVGELHSLDTPDIEAFRTLALRLLPEHPDWSAILLADPNGRVIDGVPDLGDADGDVHAGTLPWARAAATSGSVVVSNLFRLPDQTGPYLMVGVPELRAGKVIFVLGARLKTDGLRAMLVQQQTPFNGVVGLADSSGLIIARNREPVDGSAATSISAALADQSSRANEGSWRGDASDGTSNYAAFSRSAQTGLMVALGLPTEEVDAPIRRILWILAAWWFVILGSGAGLGLLFGGVIVRALTSASRASMALARGEPIAPAASRIAEIDDLAMGLRQAATTLQARNRERDEASRLKDEFLMTVSHELRTPLTAICGWARMLSSGEIRESQRGRALEAIDRNAMTLNQLVDDLLDMSRIVAGRLRLDVQSVKLDGLVSAAVDTVRPAAQAKGIEIATTIDPAAASIMGDPVRLQQVIWNLLSNAVRFTPKDGRIEVRVAQDGARGVEIAVADSGSGVQPDFLPHVFERFRQADTGTTRTHGGLGLGLAIVRHLVELHGGTVRAENNTGGPGATFRIILPAGHAVGGVREDHHRAAEVA